jgi:hypothetical protein
MERPPAGAAARSHVGRLTQGGEMIAAKTSAPFVQLNGMRGMEERMAYELESKTRGQ